MPYKRLSQQPIRRTEPVGRVLEYVKRRMGYIEQSEWRQAQRDTERAPRGRR